MKMKYSVVNGDVLTAPRGTALAFFTSADYGYVSPVENRIAEVYNMREKIMEYYPDDLIEPGYALLVEDVFNLVVKENSYDDTTHNMVKKCLDELRAMMFEFKIKKVAIPKCDFIFDWTFVEETIQNLFAEDDVEITVYVV